MKKYFSFFLIFISILSVCILFYTKNLNPEENNITWYLFIYFILLTSLFHYGIVRTTQSRPQVFIRYYMASTTFKLLLHLGIIVVYSLFHRNEAVRFIFTFMILYFLFTIFEVMFVWRNIRKF